MRGRKQYRSKDVSCASKEKLITPSAATRLGTRLAQFSKLINILRGASFYANQLEESSLTRAERAEHAKLAAWSDTYLKQLLNFSELGKRWREAMSPSSPSARDPRLSNSSILKGRSK